MKPSDILRELADKIDKNAPEDFGGAYCIIPPSTAAGSPAPTPLSNIFVGSVDIVSFLALIKTKLDTLTAELDGPNMQQRQRR